MTETELLRLPEIPEGPPAEQLKAVKRYLCRLAEQLEYILTNERRERLREQERSRTLEDRLAASPKVAEGILAASARRFGSQYVELQDYERDRGWYDHGLYPFVLDPMFRTAGSPCGFGYIDVAKSAQEYVDRGNQAIMQNLLANARPRHFIRADGAVNEEEYGDMTRDFVHVDGNLGEDSIKPISGKSLSDIYVTVIANKIDELKEVTGTRDVTTGGTVHGVTAASAIAAMQEAGSKLSRDSNMASYRAFRKVCLMAVELIRQFYDLPRAFRILGPQGGVEFITFSNEGLKPQDQGVELGVELGMRTPLFDIEISAEKQSPYSRLSQNEMAMQFYSAGLFDPARSTEALTALDMMDFNGKSALVEKVRQNGGRYQAELARPQVEPMAEGKMRLRSGDNASPV